LSDQCIKLYYQLKIEGSSDFELNELKYFNFLMNKMKIILKDFLNIDLT